MVPPKIGVSMLYELSEPFSIMIQKIPVKWAKNVEIVDEGLHELNKQRTRSLKEVANSFDLKYSVHSPFAGINIALISKFLRGATMRRLRKSLTLSADLGCDLWIFHPGMKAGIGAFYPGLEWATNMESIRLISGFARDCGVRIGIENCLSSFLMKNVEDFKRFYAEFDRDIGLVLDTGHANIIKEVDEFLKTFPRQIVHVHAHDNKGGGDEHLGIGHGSIDWNSFASLVRKSSAETVIVESIEHVKQSVDKLRQLLS